MRTLLAFVLVSVLSISCAFRAVDGSVTDEPPLGAATEALGAFQRAAYVQTVPSPLMGLETDLCDDDLFADKPWIEKTEGNITYRFAPGSAAERDFTDIAAVRTKIYDTTAAFLGVASPGPIKLVLSPSRAAAKKNGYANGRAYITRNTAEVVYTGAENSFEKRQPGHEITHLIAAKIDAAPYHLAFLEEGLAELLDGSGRDMHASYVNTIRVGYYSTSVTRLTTDDVTGRSYGRAGSFVKFVIDTYGKEKFIALWKAAPVTWSGTAYITKAGDPLTDPATLEKALDQAMMAAYGVTFETARKDWEKVLAPYLLTSASVDKSDAAAIQKVVKQMDDAVNTADHMRLRATMEGYYCDSTSDAQRLATATAAVQTRGKVQTTIVSILPYQTRSFPEIVVHAVRTEVRDGVETKNAVQIWMEKFPVGWRVTYAVW